jgi:hypothetical protein
VVGVTAPGYPGLAVCRGRRHRRGVDRPDEKGAAWQATGWLGAGLAWLLGAGAALVLGTLLVAVAPTVAEAGGFGTHGPTHPKTRVVEAYATYYGWFTNTPPGCATAYSGCAHSTPSIARTP